MFLLRDLRCRACLHIHPHRSDRTAPHCTFPLRRNRPSPIISRHFFPFPIQQQALSNANPRRLTFRLAIHRHNPPRTGPSAGWARVGCTILALLLLSYVAQAKMARTNSHRQRVIRQRFPTILGSSSAVSSYLPKPAPKCAKVSKREAHVSHSLLL